MTSILVGKVLRHIEEDTYCASRFTHDLGNGVLLAMRLNVNTGKDLLAQHIVQVAELTEDDEIYNDFATMEDYYRDKESLLKEVGGHTIQ